MVKGISKYFLGIVLVVGLISCEQKPDLEQIYNDLPEDEVLAVDTSLIFAGFGISISDIEKKINSELGDNLYSEKEYVDRGGVRMKLNVDRTGKIELSGSDNKLFYKIPVHLKGKILINEKLFGVKIRAEPGFELNLTLNLASSFEFYDDFKFGVFTEIAKIDWPRRPVIQAGPISVDLTDAIESVLKANENALSNIISQTAKSELNLRDLIKKSASQIPRFNYVNSKDIKLWMELEPLSLIIESKPNINNDSIKINAGLTTFLKVVSFKGDSSFIDIDNLNLLAIKDIPEKFSIEMKVSLSYKDLDSLLLNQINKRDLLKSLPEDISINNLRTGQAQNKDIYLSAEIDGKVQGMIFNRGKLKFDTISNSIYLDEMKSDFYSDNWLWSILFKGFFPGIKSQIQSKIRWPIEPLFLKVQTAVKKLFVKLSGKGELNLELKNLQFRVKDFNLRKDELDIIIRIEGQSEFNYKV